jgi:hypothetical protein
VAPLAALRQAPPCPAALALRWRGASGALSACNPRPPGGPKLPRHKLNIWDVGGQKTLRPYWRNYFEKTDGLIWVVDSADLARLGDCRDELARLLQEERLHGATLLIMANKQDVASAFSMQQIEEVGAQLPGGEGRKRREALPAAPGAGRRAPAGMCQAQGCGPRAARWVGCRGEGAGAAGGGQGGRADARLAAAAADPGAGQRRQAALAHRGLQRRHRRGPARELRLDRG